MLIITRSSPHSAIGIGTNCLLDWDCVTVSTASYTKNQHYVWCHYLEAWATTGTFCCYRQKAQKLFPTRPRVVANETYFYETQQLTVPDKEFLESIISRGSDKRLRELNRNFVAGFQRSFELRNQLACMDSRESAKAEAERELRIVEKTLGEHYHMGIETMCVGILDSLRRKNDRFYQDVTQCGHFIYFLSNQYFRTVKMRRAISGFTRPVPGHDPRRTSNIECFVYALNLSDGLFRERDAYKIVFLQNDASTPFITGDQPIVNMLNPIGTGDVELYYPLSPSLAIVLTKDTLKFPRQERVANKLEVENYNYMIYRESEDQVYSNDQGYLHSLVSIGKHVLSR
jgi:Protein of unknown function (DUF4238)